MFRTTQIAVEGKLVSAGANYKLNFRTGASCSAPLCHPEYSYFVTYAAHTKQMKDASYDDNFPIGQSLNDKVDLLKYQRKKICVAFSLGPFQHDTLGHIDSKFKSLKYSCHTNFIVYSFSGSPLHTTLWQQINFKTLVMFIVSYPL